MAFGSWFKQIKDAAKDFVNGFKYGWNKTKSIIDKIPLVNQVSKMLPKFDNSKNPALEYFGSDGYYTAPTKDPW